MRPSRRHIATQRITRTGSGAVILAAAAIAGAALCSALPPSAFGAGAFDGSYRGTQRTLRSNGSGECANLNHDNVLLVIQDNHFNRHWGPADLAVDVAANGSFSARSVTGDRARLRTIAITGQITGKNLEADIGTDLCAAHLSLTKS